MALKELIKPGKQKLRIDLALSIAWLALVFLHPFFGYDRIISEYDIFLKAAILSINFLVSLIFFYPMSCGLAFVWDLAKKKKQSSRWELAAAVFFILFFNPIFVSCAAITLNHLNDSMNKPCGAEITGFAEESAARDSGMSVGEDIVSMDGYPVDTVENLKHILGGKNPGDYVTVKTDKKEYRIAVQGNQDKSAKVIGVIISQKYCPI